MKSIGAAAGLFVLAAAPGAAFHAGRTPAALSLPPAPVLRPFVPAAVLLAPPPAVPAAIKPVLTAGAAAPPSPAAAVPAPETARPERPLNAVRAELGARFDGAARDESRRFSELLDDEVAGRPLPAQASQYRYLLVPGLGWRRRAGYMAPNLLRLRSAGLEAELVPTAAAGLAGENAAAVRAAVERSPRPVVIIAHSKGALDALAAFPQPPGKVRALVALQAPYGGSPMAQWVLAHPWVLRLMRLGAFLRRPLSGLPARQAECAAVLAELTPAARAACSAPPDAPGTELFSLAGRVAELSPRRWRSWLRIRVLGLLPARESDGTVTVAAAAVPGSRRAVVQGLGHLDSVLPLGRWDSAGRRLGPRELTGALVRWVASPRGT